ncbi:AAA family ATPase [Deferribacter autotrophicus]|uniref:AAA family ATPase n=1 Tax=Deferribacter autotrophicus TaxID=500465 RepID=A0A5A8F517_9BACT|nr:AAA family ATPase [Deferribacter autotrophicus]KAA0259171.1 AAA family ATPase [Deferribacter autotrophicus]
MGLKEFYGLKELPFNNTPDLKYFFKSEKHSLVLYKLNYLINYRKGLGIVLGPIGTGKTILARLFFEELDPEKYEAALIVVVHSEVSSEWFLKKLCLQLGIQNIPSEKHEMVNTLYKELSKINEMGKKVVILIDEAQMLSKKEVIEEMRGLLNFEDEKGKLITFVLFGLPELESNLRQDKPLFQRVSMRLVLEPLDLNETLRYIKHRLKIAGSEELIFESEAIKKIYEYSKGIPRLINTICDNALFEGFLIKKHVINKDLIEQVAQDLGLA